MSWKLRMVLSVCAYLAFFTWGWFTGESVCEHRPSHFEIYDWSAYTEVEDVQNYTGISQQALITLSNEPLPTVELAHLRNLFGRVVLIYPDGTTKTVARFEIPDYGTTVMVQGIPVMRALP